MSVEISIVMPCLNEAETLALCIKKAQTYLNDNNIQGEVIIGDNGSTDGSQEIAKSLGARVIDVTQKGYGSASRGAIEAALGTYIITADTDDSHDLLNLNPFVEKLRKGYDLVMGNRFKGERQENSMPFLHRYVGNPILTFIGNLFFKTNIGDFHCGLRGFTRDAYNNMNLNTTGMEFASEILVKASMLNLKITEVPTIVFPAGRTRKAHLRTFPDGWRHLRFLLLYSPKWLFLFPGIVFMIIGFLSVFKLVFNPSSSANFKWLTLSSGLFLVGFQFALFYALTKIYATNHGLIPKAENYETLFKYFTLERGLLFGFLLTLVGVGFSILELFQNQSLEQSLIVIVPASIGIVLGVQIMLFSFFFSILGLTDTD
jgi:glycosyltransferase involved in cell wall biosynthesis